MGTFKDGVAKLELTSLLEGGDRPVTLTVLMEAGAGVQHPAVTGILAAKGKAGTSTY